MEKFVNTRLLLRSQGSSAVAGGWLVAVRDNMLVVYLCDEHEYQMSEVISVRAVSDNRKAEFKTAMVKQQGRTVILASPSVVRCTHSDKKPRYLNADTAVQLLIDGNTHNGRCLDVSPNGIGLRIAAKLEVGKRYKLTFTGSGHAFQLVGECTYLRHLGENDYRTGLVLHFTNRCDTMRWANYMEGVAKLRNQDMCATLRGMYDPAPMLRSSAMNEVEPERRVC
jgi:hypothetical protein